MNRTEPTRADRMEELSLLLRKFSDGLREFAGFHEAASSLFFAQKPERLVDGTTTTLRFNEERSKAYRTGDRAYIVMYDPKKESHAKTREYLWPYERVYDHAVHVYPCRIDRRDAIAVDVTRFLINPQSFATMVQAPKERKLSRREVTHTLGAFLMMGGGAMIIDAGHSSVQEHLTSSRTSPKEREKRKTQLLAELGYGAGTVVTGGIIYGASMPRLPEDVLLEEIPITPLAYLGADVSRKAYEQLMQYYGTLVLDHMDMIPNVKSFARG